MDWVCLGSIILRVSIFRSVDSNEQAWLRSPWGMLFVVLLIPGPITSLHAWVMYLQRNRSCFYRFHCMPITLHQVSFVSYQSISQPFRSDSWCFLFFGRLLARIILIIQSTHASHLPPHIWWTACFRKTLMVSRIFWLSLFCFGPGPQQLDLTIIIFAQKIFMSGFMINIRHRRSHHHKKCQRKKSLFFWHPARVAQSGHFCRVRWRLIWTNMAILTDALGSRSGRNKPTEL